ncbi:OmpA family protein [Bradyrhizobium jicamae]|uniref:OmpA family protein n=2 Tax=Bradyrhizobium jicamae TaxID=280332 RepID=A0ABS5FR08_9BRAD|nr:OmpA family protein [Bradyrhizobium jicamae]MBR0938067.1 OmpA family protein [Bradyrhizobium jicamae]
MRPLTRGLRDGVLLAALLLATAHAPARAQQVTRDDIIAKLDHFETPAEIDIPALKQQVLERSRTRSKNEPPPQKRPPIAPNLTSLPTASLDIQFDVDTPIVLPESYQTVGRIADALTHASLLPYNFLVVGHIESSGRRENNAVLSQRRADAIRDILINTFKISAKRVQSIGLGEEQLLDPAHPGAPVNNQIQIMTISRVADTEPPPAHPAPAAPAAKKPAKKR